jgi:hypothetical protein
MGMQYDVWSVQVGSDADFYVEADTFTGTAPIDLTLATTIPGRNGYGYKVAITSSGNDEAIDFTITGTLVGSIGGTLVEEVVGGGNAETVFSTQYFSSVEQIEISGNTDGDVTVGYGGSLALPRCRIKGVYYVAGASVGNISITPNSSSIPVLALATPAGNTEVSSLYMAAEGILTTNNSADDYAVVSTTNVTSLTLLCG